MEDVAREDHAERERADEHERGEARVLVATAPREPRDREGEDARRAECAEERREAEAVRDDEPGERRRRDRVAVEGEARAARSTSRSARRRRRAAAPPRGRAGRTRSRTRRTRLHDNENRYHSTRELGGAARSRRCARPAIAPARRGRPSSRCSRAATAAAPFPRSRRSYAPRAARSGSRASTASLDLLAEQNLVQKLDLGDGRAHYERVERRGRPPSPPRLQRVRPRRAVRRRRARGRAPARRAGHRLRRREPRRPAARRVRRLPRRQRRLTRRTTCSCHGDSGHFGRCACTVAIASSAERPSRRSAHAATVPVRPVPPTQWTTTPVPRSTAPRGDARRLPHALGLGVGIVRRARRRRDPSSVTSRTSSGAGS